MATNLVSVVMQFLTPDMIAKIASALGLDAASRKKPSEARYPPFLQASLTLPPPPMGHASLPIR
jgi:hypothetical protein